MKTKRKKKFYGGCGQITLRPARWGDQTTLHDLGGAELPLDSARMGNQTTRKAW